MRTVAISILLAAGAALASTANAQEASLTPPAAADPVMVGGYSPPTDAPPSFWSDNVWSNRYDVQNGVAALEANDFTRAEEIFDGILRYNRNDTAVRFYMGVAKMNLGKWDEAKRYLMTAARKWRELPDPKSRLGVTYAKLGDIAGANAQRARLVKMAEACKGTCKLSPHITDGIQMIDEALAKPTGPEPQGLG